ncbi:MAG: hypothetical protein ACK4IX_13955, partial [Candidatus Sericytochromatia bacterium]
MDDNVTFTITAPKDKSWTLDISSPEDKEVIEEGGFSKEDLTKTITGTGTGEPQTIIWDGRSTNNYILSPIKYDLELKSDSQTIKKKLSINDPERIIQLAIDPNLPFSIASNNKPITQESNLIMGKCSSTEIKFFIKESNPSVNFGSVRIDVMSGSNKKDSWLYNFNTQDTSRKLTYIYDNETSKIGYSGLKYWMAEGYNSGQYLVKLGFGKYIIGDSIYEVLPSEIAKVNIVNPENITNSKLPEDSKEQLKAYETTLMNSYDSTNLSKTKYYSLNPKEFSNSIIKLSENKKLNDGTVPTYIQENTNDYNLAGLLFIKTESLRGKNQTKAGTINIVNTLKDQINKNTENSNKEYCVDLVNKLSQKTLQVKESMNNIPNSKENINSDLYSGVTNELIKIINDTHGLLYKNALTVLSEDLPTGIGNNGFVKVG